MDRILVTGATGFIGSELVARLSKEYAVTALVRTTSNRHALDPLKDALNAIEVRYANLTDFSAVRRLVKDAAPQYIVHAGAATAVRHSYENPLEFQETNHTATVNLVHAALDLPAFKKFVFASTMEIYGWQDQRSPFSEEVRPHPESPYAVAKLAAEEYLRMAGKAFGLPYLASRACNTYGRKTNAGFVVEYLATTMLRGETVYLGTPEAVRDLMYVDDHVEAYVAAIKSKAAAGVYNFGTGNQVRMMDLAERLRELTGFQGKIVPSFAPDYPWRPVTSPYLSLDARKAKADLGWSPRVSLEDGLRRTVGFWKAQRT
ncbi:MAG: GDP-mannose 4,6-dehydratase [Candidatus Aenigmarchaeota archaeon]|nr:GDP-mannose 4,6-dehydratase [Candidatus Aenigmarchaeota archaeon]